MKLSQFRYNLPQELIALYPSENRDESRLLVVNKKAESFNTKYLRILQNISMRMMFWFLIIQKFSLQDYMVIKKKPVLKLKFFC